MHCCRNVLSSSLEPNHMICQKAPNHFFSVDLHDSPQGGSIHLVKKKTDFTSISHEIYNFTNDACRKLDG